MWCATNARTNHCPTITMINWWVLLESNQSLRFFRPMYQQPPIRKTLGDVNRTCTCLKRFCRPLPNCSAITSFLKLVGVKGIEPLFPSYQGGFLTVGRYAYTKKPSNLLLGNCLAFMRYIIFCFYIFKHDQAAPFP